MSISNDEATHLLQRHKADLDRLRRMVPNMLAVSSIRFIYDRLSKMEPSVSVEFMFEVDALTSAIATSYGRLFTQTTGVTKLNESIIPSHLRSIHDQVMSLRHERYAHHGDHNSLKTLLCVEWDGTKFAVVPQMLIGMWFGASKDWAPLFAWMDSYLFQQVQRHTDHLAKVTGQPWAFADGPPPSWNPEDSREVP